MRYCGYSDRFQKICQSWVRRKSRKTKVNWKRKAGRVSCASLRQRFKWILTISVFIISEPLFLIEGILKINPHFEIQLFLVARLYSQNSIPFTLISMSSILYTFTLFKLVKVGTASLHRRLFILSLQENIWWCSVGISPSAGIFLALNLHFIGVI